MRKPKWATDSAWRAAVPAAEAVSVAVGLERAEPVVTVGVADGKIDRPIKRISAPPSVTGQHSGSGKSVLDLENDWAAG